MKITEAELRKKISGLLREFFFMSLADDGDEENEEPSVLRRALGKTTAYYDYENDGLAEEDEPEDDE